MCFAIMTHYTTVTLRSEAWTYGFILNFLDFVIVYYKHLVLKYLMQIVQVFKFVYYDVIYIFRMIKDSIFMVYEAGGLHCPATALI